MTPQPARKPTRLPACPQRGTRRAKQTVLKPTEAQLQRLIVDWLRWNRFLVIETGKQRQKGVNSVGCPDLYVWSPKWVRLNRTPDDVEWISGSGWTGIEVKIPGGDIKPEQQELADQGATVIVYSLEEAIEAVGGKP